MKKAFVLLIAVISPLFAKAACMPCGCNPAGTATAGQAIVVEGWPTQPLTMGLCCNIEPVVMTPNQVLNTFGLNITGWDVDNYDQDIWAGYIDPCRCELEPAGALPNDPVVVEWSGTINRCKLGPQQITATFKNPKVLTTSIGGFNTQGYCSQEVPFTVIESISRTLTVTIVPTTCSGCKPDHAVWTCNEYNPEPDGFTVFLDTIWGEYLSFSNDHRFDYSLKGYPYGNGRLGGEKLNIRQTVIISSTCPGGVSPLTQVRYKSGETEDGDPIWSPTIFEYITSALLNCAETCMGKKRVALGDSYGYTPLLLTSQQFHEFRLYFKCNHIIMTFEQAWENQSIWIDDASQQVGGPYNSSVKFVLRYSYDPVVPQTTVDLVEVVKTGFI